MCLVQCADGAEVFTQLERLLTAVEVWYDDPGKAPTEVVRHFEALHSKYAEGHSLPK
jgi:hypothetical protein